MKSEEETVKPVLRKRGRPSKSSLDLNALSATLNLAEEDSPNPKRIKLRGGLLPIADDKSPMSNTSTGRLAGRKSSTVANSLSSMGGPFSEHGTPSLPRRHWPTTCPVAGCDSQGHMNGRDTAHLTISGCPSYYGLTWRQCAEMRAREEGLALGALATPTAAAVSSEKEEDDKRRWGHLTVKEPSLEGLAPPMEIYQFRRAQQALVSDKEREVRRHFELSSSDKVQRIKEVVFGQFKLKTWYKSNYPDDVACMPTIYVCPNCLAYMKYSAAYQRHSSNCKWYHPPGDEIYRYKNYSFFEVDGARFREYCQKLCLLAKLFLKHKTVHEADQVAPFHFYVLAQASAEGFQLIGYFSKQKMDDQKLTGINPSMYFNVSCILTLPQFMRQGFGKMIIDFSYELSRIEGRIGSPERPLSDLGLITYRNYWREVIVKYLADYEGREISIRTMSQAVNLHITDIVTTLLSMGMIKYIRTEYYVIRKKNVIDRYLAQYSKRTVDPDKEIHSECLKWTPPPTIDF